MFATLLGALPRPEADDLDGAIRIAIPPGAAEAIARQRDALTTKVRRKIGKDQAAIRKARGLTQVQLAELAGTTQRAVSYYEAEAGFPPAPLFCRRAPESARPS